MIKAIIFDKDGVIVESEYARFEFIKAYAKKVGVHIEDDLIHKFVGITTSAILQRILHNHFTPEQGKELLKDMQIYFGPRIHLLVKPIPAVVDFIKNYKGPIQLAIASMGNTKSIQQIMDYLEITSKFSVMMSRDDVTLHKPHPEIYLKTCDELGIKPEEAVVLEDSIVGAQAAISARCTCYIVLNGLNSKEQFKDIKIRGFIQTKEDIEEISNNGRIIF